MLQNWVGLVTLRGDLDSQCGCGRTGRWCGALAKLVKFVELIREGFFLLRAGDSAGH